MPDQDPLHERLQAWKVEPTIPRRFEAEVWARIRARERGGAWVPLVDFLQWLCPAPRWAAAAAVVALLAGGVSGTLVADSADARQRAALAQRYIEIVDPYARLASPSR